jgi:hypothetical protein
MSMLFMPPAKGSGIKLQNVAPARLDKGPLKFFQSYEAARSGLLASKLAFS